MNDDELWNKAHKAGLDYYAVFGVFPEKIGIHHERLSHFVRDRIIFVERPTIPAAFFLRDDPQLSSLTYRQHVAWFKSVVGSSITWDEVYLPAPDDERRVISGDDIDRMALAKKTQEKGT